MKDREGTYDAVKCKAKAKLKPDQQQAFASSFSRRRRSSNDSAEPLEVQEQHFKGWLCSSKRRRRFIAGVVLAVVLVLLYTSQAPRHSDHALSNTGAGSYLRQIAALHDWEQTAADVAQLHQDLQASLASCAKQLLLPEVKVPEHVPRPAWFNQTGSRLPEIAALDLNCSNPAHAAACAESAASNSYDGDSLVLTPDEVAALLQASFSPAVKPYSPAEDPLASLEVDCAARPETCATVSASTNSYGDFDAAADAAAVAEASAYFMRASTGAAHAWDALAAQQQLQELTEKERESVLARTNRYEGVQASSWQYRRQAEEAGARYLDVSVLDLDCSPAGLRTDPHAAEECARSRAVNRYESMQPYAAAAATTAPVESTTSSGAGASNSRVLSAAHAANSAEAGRKYYKNPCNSPAGREQYKNPQNQLPAQRKYYKNPANAPAALEVLLPQAVKAPQVPSQPTTGLSSILRSTSIWVTLAVLLATCLVLDDIAVYGLGKLRAGFANVRRWCNKALGRRTQVRRTRAMMLVPCASQELPAPQLMQVELPLRSPLPVLSALASTCSPAAQHVPHPTQDPASAGNQPEDVMPSLCQSDDGHNAAQAQAVSPTSLVTLMEVTTVGVIGGSSMTPTSGPFSAAAGAGFDNVDSGMVNLPDAVQSGIDSPRAGSRAGHRLSITPLPSRSRAGTPGPGKVV